jgi:uncharacterized protein
MERRLEFLVGKQKVVGDLYLPEGLPAPFPCVITSHGYKSNRKSEKWLQVGRRLPLEGVSVLTIDHRGALNGESDGLFENTTLSTRIEDLRAAIETVSQIPEINRARLGLMGSSLGGMDVLMNNNATVNVKVVMSTPFRISPPSEAMKTAFEKQGYWDYLDGTRIRRDFYEDLNKHDVIAKLSRENCPLMVIHGDLDELVPRHHSRVIYENTGSSSKALHLIAGADHSFSDLVKLNEALACAFDWLKRYLLAAATPDN